MVGAGQRRRYLLANSPLTTRHIYRDAANGPASGPALLWGGLFSAEQPREEPDLAQSPSTFHSVPKSLSAP